MEEEFSVPRNLIARVTDTDGDEVSFTDEGDHFEIRISDADTPSTDFRRAYISREDLEKIARRSLAYLADGKE